MKVDKKRLLVFTLIFILFFKLFITLSFNNSDWEPDSFMHFLELRTIFADFPNNLALGLGVWTKPLYAYPLGFIVQVFNIKELFFIEIINISISIFIGYLVYRMVHRLFGSFKIAILSLLLVSLSLTFFKSSVSALTDQIFALMLILGGYFALNKKYYLASLFFGLSVIGRIEGLFFMAIYNLWLIWEIGQSRYTRKALKNIILNWGITLIPVVIWNLLGYLNTGLPLFIFQGGYPTKPGIYGFGNIFSYPKMFLLQEFILSILFVLGSVYLLRTQLKSGRFRFTLSNFLSNKFLTLSWVLFSGFVFVEAILWKLGIFGSAGLMRYFVGVIPFMVIIAAYGIYNLFLKLKQNQQIIFVFVILLVNIVLLTMHLSGILFKKQFPETNTDFKIAGEWIRNNVPQDEFLYADRPETIYYSGRDLTNSANRLGEEFRGRSSGVYVWSKEWGPALNDLYPKDFKDENILFKIEDSIYIFKID